MFRPPEGARNGYVTVYIRSRNVAEHRIRDD